MSFAHTTNLNGSCLACVDEYNYEIEELSDLIKKNSRLLLKIEYQISLKPDCFNIHFLHHRLVHAFAAIARVLCFQAQDLI